ncbi:MAG: 2-amino-4-hydroxy-6-hydroxymethyldihydropteridine diphosphokinase, partial [Pseudomonadales bacterium]
MALIYLSLGSNIDRHRRIDAALDALAEGFGDLSISSVYESESVGFDGDSFYNLVVGINTSLAVGDVSKVLKTIEDQNDRDRSAPKFGARSLDIDILTVDDLAGEV